MGGSFPGPWGWKYHPWLKAMHESKCPENVVQKGAQLGVSELAMNLVFYYMDIKHWNCLYVLPNTHPDASDFSSSRFDPAIELSKRLQEMFTDTNNVGLKRSGSTSLYIRGSNSAAQLKSIPVALVLFDELDEINQDNIPLAEKRTDGQLEYANWKISTPRIAKTGINKYFETSTKEKFLFRCPSCSQWEELTFPGSLVITGENVNDPNLINSHYTCTQCEAILPHETKPEWLSTAIWVPENKGAVVRGFHISQLYSSAVAGHPVTLAKRALKAQDDVFEEQELFNSCLGLTHTVAQDVVTVEDILSCVGNHRQVDHHNYTSLVTMGVDVGSDLHVVINKWMFLEGFPHGEDINANAICTVLKTITVKTFEQLWKLFNNFNVSYCIIDALPETRKAKEFAERAPERIKLCYYKHSLQSREIISNEESHYHVSVSRTMWFDMLLSRFKNKTIILPLDRAREYDKHLSAMVKIPKVNRAGERFFAYDASGPDHYAHASCYAEIALCKATGGGSPTTLSESL